MKAGFVGVIGYPNAGKSTLVNALVSEKVSIVTHKPQTTRQKVLGLWTDDQVQIIFLDAPGVIHSTAGLNEFLQEEYKSVINEADVLIATLNVDAAQQNQIESVIQLCVESKKPWVAVITKSDKKQLHRVERIMNLLEPHQVPIIKVKAKNKPQEAHDEIVPVLKTMLPYSEAPLFDSDITTPHNLRDLSAEIIREKCFMFLHQEIPYGLAVKILKFDESVSKITKIYAELVISKPSHKKMVIGVGGINLKHIGKAAREDIEKLIENKVYLDLFVSVRPQWMKSNKEMQELGYVHTK